MSVTAETNDGQVTSWVPLTNIFTPSSGCESIFRLDGPSLVAFDPGYGLDIDTAVKCAPSAVTSWWEQARLGVGGDDHTVLSIQPLICPHLWTTVATFMKDTSSKQIMCCPSGYSNEDATSGSVNGDCISSVSKGVVVTYASTAATATTDWTIETATLLDASSVGAIAVVGFSVIGATSTSTLSSSSSPTSSPSTTPPPTSSTTSPSQTQASSTSVNSPTNTGLSTGVKVGIGLGAALGVLGIIALIVAIVMLHRRGQKKSDSSNVAAPVPVDESADKPMYQHGTPEYHNPVYELHDNSERHELPHEEIRSPVEMGYPDRQGML